MTYKNDLIKILGREINFKINITVDAYCQNLL